MIKVKDLSYKYKNSNSDVLEKIDLKIHPGEITVIIGKNGSGKSTLLSCIANIFKYKGEILLDNTNYNKMKNLDLRGKLGIVFQNPNNQIIFNCVYDDIKFVLDNLKLDHIEDRINESLKMVDMEDYVKSNPYNLSMGQKQRIAIATILATKPKYILLDEVTAMLDYKGKKDIYKILMKLKREHIGIVMGTNIMEELVYADKICILDNKTIKEVLTLPELLNNLNILQEIGLEVPFILKVINKIGVSNLISFNDKELLKYIHD